MKIIVDSDLNASILTGVFPEFAESLFAKTSPDRALQWAVEWASRGHRVLTVLDADTLDPNLQEEARRSAWRVLRRTMPSDDYDLFVATPELAARVFEHASVVDFLRGKAKVDRIEGQFFAPGAALRRLFGDRDVAQTLANLPNDLRQELREDEQLEQIRRKADALGERVAA